MLLDERLEFCDATNVFGVAGTALVGDVIDLGAPGYGGVPNVLNWAGDGTPIYLVIQVTTQIITAGSAGGIQFLLVSDSIAAIAVGASTTHIISPIIITDDATALGVGIAAGDRAYLPNQAGGIVVCQAIPAVPSYERYLGIHVTNLVTDSTAGAINAFLTRTPGRYIMLPDSLPAGS